ncbi:hypothetical protein COW46_03785 [Candidatus Gracilibacteria bacterium CG17_big_fil_post_rev_8_21_14_2_50_48_13]|nr:MAG: hypothetical protein COW46_03785 [Candidatus Gracilibacteria bacterium CG17_big_fil_post_rev_8_21_14_2_50_48_13]
MFFRSFRHLPIALLFLSWTMLLPVSAQNAQDLPLGCEIFSAQQAPADQVLADSSAECSVVVCANLQKERNAFYGQVSNYPSALDEPFEELFLRLKTALGNYETTLQGICGTEALPLPVCTNRSGIGDKASSLRAQCDENVRLLVDAADTVLQELLLQMAGNQRTHAYARRIDALTQEFRKMNDLIAQITTYLAKITLPTIVGDPVKQ